MTVLIERRLKNYNTAFKHILQSLTSNRSSSYKQSFNHRESSELNNVYYTVADEHLLIDSEMRRL